MILSTHIVSDIESIANHVIMIKEKTVIKNDTVPNICKGLRGRYLRNRSMNPRSKDFKKKRIFIHGRGKMKKGGSDIEGGEKDKKARNPTPKMYF